MRDKIPIEEEEQGRLALTRSIVDRARLSIGSREYQRLTVVRGEGWEEVIYDGEYACAYQTSTPYHGFGLLSATHSTVDGLEKELASSPLWEETGRPKAGVIGILPKKKFPGGKLGTRHTFICLDEIWCVHNDPTPGVRTPQAIRIDDFRHHTGEQRLAEAYYIHQFVLAEQ